MEVTCCQESTATPAPHDATSRAQPHRHTRHQPPQCGASVALDRVRVRVRVGLPCDGRFCGAEKMVRRKFAEESEITYTLDAVVGGPVVCFALRVVGALQYLCSRGWRISSSVFYSSWGVVVSRRANFSRVGSFLPRCVWQKKGMAVTSARGRHRNSLWCGPDLTFGATAIREVLNSGVWVG